MEGFFIQNVPTSVLGLGAAFLASDRLYPELGAIFCEEDDADVRMAKIEKVKIWQNRVAG